MTLLHIPLGSNPNSWQFHTLVDVGWISLISEGVIIFFKIGLLLSSISREYSSYLLTLLYYLCSNIIVISIAEFISSLLWILLYMRQILWNINHASLGSLCFALLWLKPEFLSSLLLFFVSVPQLLPHLYLHIGLICGHNFVLMMV